jgi:hypothetical protein
MPESLSIAWSSRDEELWYEIFIRCVYGGMAHETVRDRVAILSPYGQAFADLLHERWRAAVAEIRGQAISGSLGPREARPADGRSSRRTH